MTHAELLSRAVNFAVVQLPERRSPGVVVQGDALHGLIQQLDRMSQLLDARDLDELAAELLDMKEQLGDALRHYETICAKRGISLPY